MTKKIYYFFCLLFIANMSFAQQWAGSNTVDGEIYRNGSIGLGTTKPVGYLSFGAQGDHLTIGRETFESKVILGTGWTSVNSDYTDILVPGAGKNNALIRLQANGSVGIGTSTPAGYLSFGAQGDNITIGRDGFANKVILGTGWTSGNSDYTDIRVPGAAQNNALIRLQANGSVGIGTNTPAGDLSFGAQGNNITIGRETFASKVIIGTGWTSATSDYTDIRVPGGTQNNALLRLQANGNVAIGTTNAGSFKLAVEGNIGAREVRVTNANPWPDYVFSKNYERMNLASLETYINQNNHLPNIPSAQEVKDNGIELGRMNAKLIEKIEELTLYVIDLKKEIDPLKKEMDQLKKDNADLKKQLLHSLKP